MVPILHVLKVIWGPSGDVQMCHYIFTSLGVNCSQFYKGESIWVGGCRCVCVGADVCVCQCVGGGVPVYVCGVPVCGWRGLCVCWGTRMCVWGTSVWGASVCVEVPVCVFGVPVCEWGVLVCVGCWC